MPPSENSSDRSAFVASNDSVPKSSKMFIQARIDSIISSTLDKTEEQSTSKADQLKHVQQRVQKQEQDTDSSDTKSDPGTKSNQDQEKKLSIPKSYSSYDASNLSAGIVADMIKRLKARQQQREQDELKVFPGEQISSEADQLNHVQQREQKQDTDFTDTKSDPGTKSNQDQEKKLSIPKSYSSYDASNLSADVVADMIKRLKLARQQRQREQDEHVVFTGEQISSEADQLNHVQQRQREQEQHTDFSDAKSDPGTKSTQDQEDKMPNSKSYSSYDASNLSADVVADMIKRLKLARQQRHCEQDEHIVLPGTKHPRYLEYPFGEVHIIGDAKNRMSATFCEGCLRKQGACVCDDSYHTAIEISDDPEAGVAESTFVDVRLEGIENAVESAGINQLVTAKVEVEENNDMRTLTFRWRAFVIVALLLLIVNVLIGLLFLLARPRRAQP